jgi:hypothetical protein
MRSTDGGAHWTPPIEISNNPVVNDVDPNNGVPMRTGADIGGGLPDIAADPGSGKLYVVWEDSRFSGTHNDIAMSTSTDEGKTWSPPVKVNQTPKPVLAFTPNVHVLPNGTVGVTYYDIRNDPGLSSSPLTDYFIALSSTAARPGLKRDSRRPRSTTRSHRTPGGTSSVTIRDSGTMVRTSSRSS